MAELHVQVQVLKCLQDGVYACRIRTISVQKLKRDSHQGGVCIFTDACKFEERQE